MAIDTKKKIQLGEVTLRKKSFELIPKKNPTQLKGFSPDHTEGVKFYGDSEYNGADFIVYQLSVGCVYLLSGKATLHFPTSNAASPSQMVQVSRTTAKPFLEAHETVFPFYVETNLWHNAIVPILEDYSVNPGIPKNDCFREKNLEVYMRNLKGIIANALREYNFIP